MGHKAGGGVMGVMGLNAGGSVACATGTDPHTLGAVGILRVKMANPNSDGNRCYCVRLGQLFRYSRVLLLPLGVPPAPAPAMLHTKRGGRRGGGVCFRGPEHSIGGVALSTRRGGGGGVG